jgi:hypothetical protein
MFYEIVTQHSFIDAFRRSELRREEFSPEALYWLFQYYDHLAESTGDSIQFDMVAICSEWSEYDSLEELEEEYHDFNLESLKEQTIVMTFTPHSLRSQGSEHKKYLVRAF